MALGNDLQTMLRCKDRGSSSNGMTWNFVCHLGFIKISGCLHRGVSRFCDLYRCWAYKPISQSDVAHSNNHDALGFATFEPEKPASKILGISFSFYILIVLSAYTGTSFNLAWMIWYFIPPFLYSFFIEILFVWRVVHLQLCCHMNTLSTVLFVCWIQWVWWSISLLARWLFFCL